LRHSETEEIEVRLGIVVVAEIEEWFAKELAVMFEK